MMGKGFGEEQSNMHHQQFQPMFMGNNQGLMNN